MIPVELLTMGVSTVLGGIMSIWSQSTESKKQIALAQLDAMKERGKQLQQARKDKSLQFTRRVIAISSVLAIIVLPKLAGLWDTPVTYGWTEWQSGFLFFTEGKDIVQWHQMQTGGILLTPLDTHLVSAIIGLYFGGSLVSNR